MAGVQMDAHGCVILHIGGVARPLRFTWAALAQLRRIHGPDFQGIIADGIQAGDFDLMAQAVAAACPAVTAEEVFNASPPVIVTAHAIYAALNVANNGPDYLREAGDKIPLVQARRTAARALDRVATWFAKRFQGGSKAAASGASSGL